MTMEEKTQLSDAEWRARLTPEQYAVLRQKGTERAFTGAYTDTKMPGRVPLRRLRDGAVSLRGEVRLGLRLAELRRAGLARERRHARRHEPRDDPHRGDLRCLRRPSRPRLPGRPRPRRAAVLHQLLRARARAAAYSASYGDPFLRAARIPKRELGSPPALRTGSPGSVRAAVVRRLIRCGCLLAVRGVGRSVRARRSSPAFGVPLLEAASCRGEVLVDLSVQARDLLAELEQLEVEPTIRITDVLGLRRDRHRGPALGARHEGGVGERCRHRL